MRPRYAEDPRPVPTYPRRAFLQHLAFFGGGVVLLGGCKSEPDSESAPASPPTDEKTGRALTALQHATMAAACERVLPKDEDPGASDANVPEFVERQLLTPQIEPLKESFLSGLDLLEKRARALTKKSFAQATPAQQDELLTDFKLSPPDSGEAHFYEMLLVLTLEGFLGDPSYGGNKDGVGWKLVGFHTMPPLPGHSHSHGG